MEYLEPKIPPPNPWISREGEDKDKDKERERRHRPPSRRLVRHVLRARVEAIHALEEFFELMGNGEEVKFLGKRGGKIPKKQDPISKDDQYFTGSSESET